LDLQGYVYVCACGASKTIDHPNKTGIEKLVLYSLYRIQTKAKHISKKLLRKSMQQSKRQCSLFTG